MSKRVWKLQDFVAHTGHVHCARLGEKSGQVLATGGDDKRVNVWKVGKPNVMMSLAGHSSAVECLVFDKQEEVLVVGCAGGSMQVWNLEYRKMAGTLTGHRTACHAVEFHPYGEFFASGSADTNLKIWDLRRKSCIQTYKGHTGSISCIRFSPHGRWVATGGQDSKVKIWDLTAGKLMRDLDLHKGPINSVAFHPKEYYLATGSQDRTMQLWSLETFKSVGCTELGSSAVQAVKFYVEEQTVISASQDALRIYSTENLNSPVDCIDVDWKGLQDMRLCFPEEKLIAISSEASQLGIWVADLQKKEAAPRNAPGGYGARNNAGGASRGTNPPGGYSAAAMAKSAAADRPAERQPERSAPARPKVSPANSAQPDTEPEPEERRPRSQQQQPPVTQATPSRPVRRPADPVPVPGPAAAQAQPSTEESAPRLQDDRVGNAAGRNNGRSAAQELRQDPPVGRLDAPQNRENGFHPGRGERSPPRDRSPVQAERPITPSEHFGGSVGTTTPPARPTTKTDRETIRSLGENNPQMIGMLTKRLNQQQRVIELWGKGTLGRLGEVIQTPQDHAVMCDFLQAVMRNNLVVNLNLDAAKAMLPILTEIVASKHEAFAVTAIRFSEVLLQQFMGVITDTRRSCSNIPAHQLDLTREERLRKCNGCYEAFRDIRNVLGTSRWAEHGASLCGSLDVFLAS